MGSLLGALGPTWKALGIPGGPLETHFCEEATLQNYRFYCMNTTFRFSEGSWEHHPRGRCRAKPAPKELSEAKGPPRQRADGRGKRKEAHGTPPRGVTVFESYRKYELSNLSIWIC